METGIRESRINLSEDDPDLVEVMLDFLYTPEFDIVNVLDLSFDPDDEKYLPRFHFNLHTLGDKYTIPTPCDYAIRALCRNIKHYANDHEFISSIPYLYDHGPAGDGTLRKLIRKEIRRRSSQISKDRQTKIQLAEIVRQHSGFREDLCSDFLQHAGLVEQRGSLMKRRLEDSPPLA
ncbi:MAG: hypothetical protein Q9218_004241 [Villophora microphyllina]